MDTWQEPQTLATYLTIVLIFVFILITSIIIAVRLSLSKALEAKEKEAKLKLEHQQKLLENSILTQERERARIAADIHDELIGKLTAIKMTNEMNNNSIELGELITNGIQIARRISHDLMPPLIEYSSLQSLLRETIQPWQSKLSISFYSNREEDFAVSSDTKIHLVRIVQEILVNISKHAQAKQAIILLRKSPKCIGLSISDDGVGFDNTVKKHGLGLTNIETRVQYMQGQFKMHSVIGKGTRYVFLIPMNTDN